MLTCPNCGSAEKQVKAGREGDAQRYKCQVCKRRYIATDRRPAYTAEMRRYALELYREGVGVIEIGRRLGIQYQNISNWIRRDGSVQAEEKSSPAPLISSQERRAAPRRRSTISDVAAHAGVSITSVSNYLNGKHQLSQPTRDRIAAAIDALHFAPSALVRAIRERRTHIVGVITYGLYSLDIRSDMSMTSGILSGINIAADEAGYDVLLFLGWPSHPRFQSGLDFLNGHIDGLLWVAPDLVVPALERAAAGGLPIMGLLTRHVPESCGYVNCENITGIRSVVAHLVGLGHQRIAFCGSDHSSNAQDRRDGYRRGIAEAQLVWDPNLEVVRENITDENLLGQILDQWLSLSSPPTAIIANNDYYAFILMRLLRERGLRIPEDMAVTGVDDVPKAGLIEGGLTTLRQPFNAIGKLGMERLAALIDGAPVEECRVTLPGELVIRGSTVA